LAAALACAVALLASPSAAPGGAGEEPAFDLVLAGGRVMDPESGLDAVRHVGIRAGILEALSETPLTGAEVVDVRGLVVAPGFIDLHAHGQDARSNAFQARDGVTTALDLELGAYPVEAFLRQREGRARLHYGVSAGHIPARVKLKHGVSVVHAPTTPELARGPRAWLLRLVQRVWQPMGYAHDPASPREIARLRALLAAELDAGGIGIGFGLDYTPGATQEEIRAAFDLAAERGVLCFVHMRGVEGADDMSAMDALLAHAEASGAALHVAHITSSGGPRTAGYLERIEVARERGLDVSTEAYPYTAGSTRIESALFDEGWRERLAIDYGDLQWSETGERLSAESFARYRARGGWVIIHSMRPELVELALAHPAVMIASDGIPMLRGGEHPRGAGTFARVLGHYVRELELLGLMEALGKMTLLPAQRLEAFVPDMRRKGRIRPGADADVTVFDPARVRDRASFEDSYRESEGIVHVLVGGTFVVRDEVLVPSAFPGRPIRVGRAAEAEPGG
jgi:N-acyl-D-aspartate/D-glutamate deacylase